MNRSHLSHPIQSEGNKKTSVRSHTGGSTFTAELVAAIVGLVADATFTLVTAMAAVTAWVERKLSSFEVGPNWS